MPNIYIFGVGCDGVFDDQLSLNDQVAGESDVFCGFIFDPVVGNDAVRGCPISTKGFAERAVG